MLSRAIEVTRPGLVVMLLEAGADPDMPTPEGQSPLYIASRLCDPVMIAILRLSQAKRDVFWRNETALDEIYRKALLATTWNDSIGRKAKARCILAEKVLTTYTAQDLVSLLTGPEDPDLGIYDYQLDELDRYAPGFAVLLPNQVMIVDSQPQATRKTDYELVMGRDGKNHVSSSARVAD